MFSEKIGEFPTRHRPIKARCTANGSAAIYIVKSPLDRIRAAGCVSEWVCGCILKQTPLHIPEFALIDRAPDIGKDTASFGSKFNIDLQPVNVTSVKASQLEVPTHAVWLWVFDHWLGNTDRDVQGNLLAERLRTGKLRLWVVDQSDCFGGADGLSRGALPKVDRDFMRAHWPSVSDLVCERGLADFQAPLAAVAEWSRSRLGPLMESVPDRWLGLVQASRQELLDWLLARADRVRALCRLGELAGLQDASKGGILLDLQ